MHRNPESKHIARLSHWNRWLFSLVAVAGVGGSFIAITALAQTGETPQPVTIAPDIRPDTTLHASSADIFTGPIAPPELQALSARFRPGVGDSVSDCSGGVGPTPGSFITAKHCQPEGTDNVLNHKTELLYDGPNGKVAAEVLTAIPIAGADMWVAQTDYIDHPLLPLLVVGETVPLSTTFIATGYGPSTSESTAMEETAHLADEWVNTDSSVCGVLPDSELVADRHYKMKANLKPPRPGDSGGPILEVTTDQNGKKTYKRASVTSSYCAQDNKVFAPVIGTRQADEIMGFLDQTSPTMPKLQDTNVERLTNSALVPDQASGTVAYISEHIPFVLSATGITVTDAYPNLAQPVLTASSTFTVSQLEEPSPCDTVVVEPSTPQSLTAEPASLLTADLDSTTACPLSAFEERTATPISASITFTKTAATESPAYEVVATSALTINLIASNPESSTIQQFVAENGEVQGPFAITEPGSPFDGSTYTLQRQGSLLNVVIQPTQPITFMDMALDGKMYHIAVNEVAGTATPTYKGSIKIPAELLHSLNKLYLPVLRR